MEETSIRDRVKNIQNEILAGNLTPARASEMLTELSAIFGNVNEEIRTRDVEYNKVLLTYYESEATANRAKIKAETSDDAKEKMVESDGSKMLSPQSRTLIGTTFVICKFAQPKYWLQFR